MRYSDNELVALLDQTESDLAERKESWKGDAPEKGRQAVCAFANDLPDHRKPGVLFVGVNDKGTPTGLAISDELLQTLGSIKTDGKIVPPPTLIVEDRSWNRRSRSTPEVARADERRKLPIHEATADEYFCIEGGAKNGVAGVRKHFENTRRRNLSFACATSALRSESRRAENGRVSEE